MDILKGDLSTYTVAIAVGVGASILGYVTQDELTRMYATNRFLFPISMGVMAVGLVALSKGGKGGGILG